MPRIEHHAHNGDIIVLAGAGVSAVEPSALPGWISLNKTIMEVLAARLESALGWSASRLVEFNEHAMALLDSGRLPPEYQAQLIEEMCGERYFHALQSLDVDVLNPCHEGIATLASSGALKAIVTTNFDRLLEQALDQRGITYEVAYDDEGFSRIRERLQGRSHSPLPVIKIHGCVSAHLSMIDTLKQRQRGRSRHLQDCLDALGSGYWLYLGFSGADLATAHDYLGMADRAKRSAGGTYVARPSHPELGDGAQVLMNSHGDRGRIKRSEIAAYLLELCNTIGAHGPAIRSTDDETGDVEFKKNLQAWAERLSASATGLCLAAIYEAVGNAEGAVRLLDRLVRHELYQERNTADFRALQLHYGRLGTAWGRFIAVPDLNGMQSNASVEVEQSLMRIAGSELGFAAIAWYASGLLWTSWRNEAIRVAKRFGRDLIKRQWTGIPPRNDEDVADAWLSFAQIFVIDEGVESVSLICGTVELALRYARTSGDVVRSARIVALYGLVLGTTMEDVPALFEQYKAQFDQAERVGDGFALGMRSLALGRWHVGAGGLARANALGSKEVASRALGNLQTAISFFERQGMDPWAVYSMVQMTKALGDLRRFEEAQACLNNLKPGLERFPVLYAHANAAIWQLKTMVGDRNARQNLEQAINAAEAFGLSGMRDTLVRQCNELP